MQIEYLIIGQGISGTFLSYYLQKEKKTFLVIDNNYPGSASRIAAGIINPVTGRRIVKTWMIDELIPFIKNAYTRLGSDLGFTSYSETQIIDFFPTLQMQNAFHERKNEDDTYLHEPVEKNNFRDFFNYNFGYGIVSPVFVIQLEKIVPAWRKHLMVNNQLLEEEFDFTNLKTGKDEIIYKDISAAKIIFCDGAAAAGFTNPFFRLLPFALNKGETLLIEATGLPETSVFKKGMMICPYAEKDLFWVGSNYLWKYNDWLPSKAFREQAELHLRNWLKLPFKIIEHKASFRPATLERRPFVGMHPLYPNLGILNGMGTKGCSLAPFFAKQLVDHLIYKKEILPEADIRRFNRILSAGDKLPAGK
jgi:glycine/D-amino acid oxidase-like deaminating enzyme